MITYAQACLAAVEYMEREYPFVGLDYVAAPIGGEDDTAYHVPVGDARDARDVAPNCLEGCPGVLVDKVTGKARAVWFLQDPVGFLWITQVLPQT